MIIIMPCPYDHYNAYDHCNASSFNDPYDHYNASSL